MPLTAFSLRAFKPDTRETWAKSHKNGILPLTINLLYCHKIKSSAMPCKESYYSKMKPHSDKSVARHL